MERFNHKNTSLIIGFAIPILMIIFVAVSIYLPGIFNHPKVNFLYSSTPDYYTGQLYTVDNGRLIEGPNQDAYADYSRLSSNNLYVHDVVSNQSRQVALEEARKLTLDSSTTSPDGYKIESGRGSGFFLFGGDSGDYNSQYLVGQNTSKKLNVKATNPGNYGWFHFIGWIKN